jgi:hypothetical protein
MCLAAVCDLCFKGLKKAPRGSLCTENLFSLDMYIFCHTFSDLSSSCSDVNSVMCSVMSWLQAQKIMLTKTQSCARWSFSSYKAMHPVCDPETSLTALVAS